MDDGRDRVRVVRILVYEGPERWLDSTLDKRYVKGTVHPGGAGKSIREVYIDQFDKYFPVAQFFEEQETEEP